MRKLVVLLMIFTGITSFSNGQAFEKGGKYLSLGIGGANFWHFGNFTTGKWNTFAYTPITGQFNVQFEYGVHEYVGVGLTTGVGGSAPLGLYNSEFNIPVGVVANCHFWKIIADKTGKGQQLKSDKLDLYAGLNVGTGFGAIITRSDVVPAALFFAGPQVGVRYFFTDKLAVNGEVGYGKSWINGGITLKL